MGSHVWAARLIYINVALAVIMLALPVAPVSAARLAPVRGFVCYYGPPKLEELGRYPLAIIESTHYTAEQIAQLKRGGTTVIAYLSVGEILEPSRATAPAAPPAPGTPRRLAIAPYYLDRDGDGKPDKNPGWGGFYTDARSPAWQSRVVDELAAKLLTEKGADGLFLDTVDTVDAYPETKPGMIELIKKLRAKYPKAPIIANRGFTILEGIVPSIDGVLFEAFTTHYDPTSNRSRLHPPSDLEWVDGILARLRAASRDGSLQVLVLDYADPKDPKVKDAAIRRAKASGLTYSISTGSLDKMPIDGGAGK
jgi:hypothetical protein